MHLSPLKILDELSFFWTNNLIFTTKFLLTKQFFRIGFTFVLMREFVSYSVPENFKVNLIGFVQKHSCACVLLSNKWSDKKYELLAGIGCLNQHMAHENCFEALKHFYEKKHDWLFGHFCYEASSILPIIARTNEEGVNFPLMYFFQPEFLLCLRKGNVEIGYLPDFSNKQNVEELFQHIISTPAPKRIVSVPALRCGISQEEYMDTIEKIKKHIQRGDIYEMNYCMKFFSEQATINPSEVFLKLNETTDAPFSAFYKIKDNYLLCASPERFLKKEGKKIISQPIKGTARRGRNLGEDILQKEKLVNSVKDKSENAMIADLVRNDLSRTCYNVKAEELFGIYSFKQWHQMISTISGEIREGIHFIEVIENAFPMGSMTGAPKIRAMELIREYEKTTRGLYSGTVGYITPDGDFDFNVVIRSILYNEGIGHVSFFAGSAITAQSVPSEEYQECFIKARGMFLALNAEWARSTTFQNSFSE